MIATTTASSAMLKPASDETPARPWPPLAPVKSSPRWSLLLAAAGARLCGRRATVMICFFDTVNVVRPPGVYRLRVLFGYIGLRAG